MPRPAKARRVCKLPQWTAFGPTGQKEAQGSRLQLNVEEYEIIRLMDYKGYSQEECARQMGVSRSTIQALYNEARKKMARFLVEGCQLEISGGFFALCSEQKEISCPGHSACSQRNRFRKEGESKMKIAVTYENGQIFQHFGHTEQFKVYETEEGKVVNSMILDTNGNGHGALAGFLAAEGVEVLICGGIGGGARNALAEAGIKIYPGAMGDADGQVESFLAGSLAYDPDTMCNHHGEGHTCGGHHHEEGHTCGGHHHEEGHSCGGHHGCH